MSDKRKKINNGFTVLQYLSFLTQLGLSIISPLILLLALAYFLDLFFEVGTWVYIVAIVLGVGGGISAFVTFAKYALKKIKKQNDKPPTSFNS